MSRISTGRSSKRMSTTNEAAASGIYRVSPEVAVERFGDEALILVPPQDRFLTVNKAAADLFELLQATFAETSFSQADLSAWLAEQYRLTRAQCEEEARKILTSWSKLGLLLAEEGKST